MRHVIFNTGETAVLDYEFICNNMLNIFQDYTERTTLNPISDDGIWVEDVIDDTVFMSTSDNIRLSDEFISTYLKDSLISIFKTEKLDYELYIQEIV